MKYLTRYHLKIQKKNQHLFCFLFFKNLMDNNMDDTLHEIFHSSAVEKMNSSIVATLTSPCSTYVSFFF